MKVLVVGATGSIGRRRGDPLMDGGVTAAYWYGDVAEVRTS